MRTFHRTMGTQKRRIVLILKLNLNCKISCLTERNEDFCEYNIMSGHFSPMRKNPSKIHICSSDIILNTFIHVPSIHYIHYNNVTCWEYLNAKNCNCNCKEAYSF